MKAFLVNSVGGCGSKYIVKNFFGYTNLKNPGSCHGHIKKPSDIPSKFKKVVFVFGCPYHSIISFFNRRTVMTENHGFGPNGGLPRLDWHVKHCKNISGSYQLLSENWSVEDYLQCNRDLFGLNDFYYQWMVDFSRINLDFSVCRVRYETLGENIPQIAKFLDIPNFKLAVPFVDRMSQYLSLSEEGKMRMQALYGDLKQSLDEMKDFETFDGTSKYYS